MEVESIANIARKTLKKIGLDSEYCIVNLSPKHDGSFHIEKDAQSRFHIIATERGHIFSDEVILDEDEVLFRIYESNTWEYSAHWEPQNRISGQDSRILLFTKHLQLLEQIDKKYALRLFEKYKRLINGFKYKDFV